MPSRLHDGIVELLCGHPSLTTRLLGDQGPAGGVPRPAPADVTDLHPAELRTDAVFVYDDPPTLAVIVEVQLQVDGDKRWTWPAYAAGLRLRMRCPVVLLVITLDAATERACRRTIGLGPGFSLTPRVVGPAGLDRPPRSEDPVEQALLRTLAALATGADARIREALDALFRLRPTHEVALAHDMLVSAFAQVRSIQESLMQSRRYEFQSEFAVRHRSEGREEGREEGRAEHARETLREMIVARELARPADLEDRLAAADLATLSGWLRRAMTAPAGADVFAADGE